METRTVETSFGEVELRNVMIDTDGTNLVEGIEIEGDEIDTIEVYGYYDIDELSVEEIEELIEDNL